MATPPGVKGRRRPPEYAVWKALGRRCVGRAGARVCDRWRGPGGFASFLADVGPRPVPGAGIVLTDEAGDYGPGNAAWGDTRPCRPLTYGGRTLSVVGWAAELGVKAGTLRARQHNGWPLDRVLARRVAYRRPAWTWDR